VLIVEWLKTVHVTCVILSFSGFLIRGLWVLAESDKLENNWVRRVPHVIDTVLLGSALLMLYTRQISVLDNDWLMAKIGALLIYILLGVLALKPGRKKNIRVAAWLSGMCVFGYIVSVALSKSPGGFLNWL